MAKSKSGSRAKARKKKRKRKPEDSARSHAKMSSTKETARSEGGGVMQSLRQGFKNAAGAGEREEKSSTFSNVLWTVLLLAAAGVFIYRYYLQ